MTPAVEVRPSGARTIEIDALARRFGATQAIRPFRVSIGPGGVTGLLGPNGSGKSTLLRLITGLVRPDRGGARVDGVELAGDGTAVRRRVAYAPGEIALYGELTGRAHLAWLVAGRDGGARARALALAGELGLPLERRVRGYSHGMKRQLLVCAALAPDLGVRILDEPTEGLDPTKRAQVLELIARDAARGTTILLSSHHLGEIDRVCTRRLFLRQGELLDEGAALEIERRARRVLRLTFPAPPPCERLERVLARVGASDLRLAERRATLLLPEHDPRASLSTLLADPELPPPESCAWGELSLAELYRTLYGAEGI
jgi:ABC-2 type transport system ATP-binding protein